MNLWDKLKIWIARIFCLHEWENNICSRNILNNMAVYGKGMYKAYICKKCGKEIMSFVEPLSYYKR